MGGMADGGPTEGQDPPEDLVSVREAAQAVGIAPSTVHGWIKSGRLTAQPSLSGRRVSLAAVQSLAAPLGPDTPADAVAIFEVLRLMDVPSHTIVAWVTQGRLPSWHGRYGMLVRVADVQALAQQRAMMTAAAGDGTPLPPDALSVRDAARLSGLSRERLYMWTKQGLLPVWLAPGGGQRVRLADVTVLAERHGRGLPLQPRGAP